MPTFNRAYCVWKSIASVVQQTHPDWELVVVDDGSTDETKQVVASFGDPRIRYVYKANGGPASARDRGLREAKGEFVGYVDSDDSLHPKWLEEMNRALQADPSRRLIMPNKNYRLQLLSGSGEVEQVFTQKVLFGPQLAVSQLVNLEVECDTNGLIHSRDLGLEAGGWDVKLDMYEDYDFLLRMLDRAAEGFYFLPLVLADYTRSYGNDSLCNQATYDKLVASLEYLLKKHTHTQLFQQHAHWNPTLIQKFQKAADKGETVLEHLLNKYSTS
jgi:glycosyltransferase involved in cell wall biosynthesis